jgi:hypothetical protein
MSNSNGLARGSRGLRGPYRRKPQVARGERRGRGRPKGSRNVLTRVISDAILEAAEQVGEDGKGKGGLVGYLKRVAKKDPKVFCSLLGRVLPLQKEANMSEIERQETNTNVNLRITTLTEALARMEELGLPAPEIEGDYEVVK